MNEFSIVQIISLVGFLILALSALASHRLDWGKAIRMGLVWAAIFVGIALLFSIVGPGG
ncbi:hypothetical protein [Altererythrobacter sp. Z27]|uniref:hypothetical protein n=1 Tax=Altererythrobacter sp. Z27 TaxID=3461147 RepID=UPI0040439BF1